MCTDTKWLTKHGITSIVTPLQYPGPYQGNLHATKFKYKEDGCFHNEYMEHMPNTTVCLTKDSLINLETNGAKIRHTPMKIYTHIKDKCLLP